LNGAVSLRDVQSLLEPEEFVGPVVFLCSNAASAVTGMLLPVDGSNLGPERQR